MLLRELLIELEGELERAGAPVSQLAPPNERKIIRAKFEAAGLCVPDEAIEWFGWKSGLTVAARKSNPGGPLPLFEMWSQEEIISSRQHLASSSDFGPESWQWSPSWLHLIGDNNGIAVRMTECPANPPLVRSMQFGSPNTDPAYIETQVVSLCTPVYWWLEDLRSGIFRWDGGQGRWSADFKRLPEWRRVLGFG